MLGYVPATNMSGIPGSSGPASKRRIFIPQLRPGGEGWPKAATSGQSPLMCFLCVCHVRGRYRPNFAMPNDKALIVDRQKVELEAKPLPVFVLPGATDLDP